MSRSSKKKPYVQEKLLKRIEAMNETGRKRSFKNMVKSFYYISTNDWTHNCCL